jgi:hypothetical protein
VTPSSHPARPRSATCIRWLLGLLAVALLAGVAFAEGPAAEPQVAVAPYGSRPQKPIDITIRSQPMSEVIANLMNQVGANYIFDPSAAEALAKEYPGGRIRGVTVDHALQSLIYATGITYVAGVTRAPGAEPGAEPIYTYLFYSIDAQPNQLRQGDWSLPPMQLETAAKLFAGTLAKLAADMPEVTTETITLKHVDADKALGILQPLTSYAPRGPARLPRPIPALGVFSDYFTESGAARLRDMEQAIAQKDAERKGIVEKQGADSPEAVKAAADLDELREHYAALQNQVGNEVAQIIRLIAPAGPIPVYLTGAGEGGNQLLVMGTPEAVERAKRAIAVIDQAPPQAEFDAYVDVALESGGKPYRFNLTTHGVGRVGETQTMTSKLTSVPQSAFTVKVTPRAATPDAVMMDTSWEFSAQLRGAPLTIPVEVRQNLEAPLVVPAGQRMIVYRWALSGVPDVTGTLTFSIVARSTAAPAAPAAASAPPVAMAPTPVAEVTQR